MGLCSHLERWMGWTRWPRWMVQHQLLEQLLHFRQVWKERWRWKRKGRQVRLLWQQLGLLFV